MLSLNANNLFKKKVYLISMNYTMYVALRLLFFRIYNDLIAEILILLISHYFILMYHDMYYNMMYININTFKTLN